MVNCVITIIVSIFVGTVLLNCFIIDATMITNYCTSPKYDYIRDERRWVFVEKAKCDPEMATSSIYARSQTIKLVFGVMLIGSIITLFMDENKGFHEAGQILLVTGIVYLCVRLTLMNGFQISEHGIGHDYRMFDSILMHLLFLGNLFPIHFWLEKLEKLVRARIKERAERKEHAS